MKINIYTAFIHKHVTLYPDFVIESILINCINENKDIDTYQMLFLYALKSIVARKLVDITNIELYVDDINYKVLSNGRLLTYPPIDLYESFIDNVLEV